MSEQVTTPDIPYKGYFIRPIEYPDGATTITRFAVVNPDGALSEYIGCRDIEAAQLRIDAVIRRAEAQAEALAVEAAKRAKLSIDTAAILSAAGRFEANKRRMGRCDNDPAALI